MSHLVKLNDTAGYDRSRNLQMLGIGDRTTFHLIAADDLVVELDGACARVTEAAADLAHTRGAGRLSQWERGQAIRVLTLHGVSPGRATLHARRSGADWIEPLTVAVTQDPDRRQVNRSGQAADGFGDELRRIQGGLRAAVLRVAEDQMNSRVTTRSGFGDYPMDNPHQDWCGAFAHWCWRRAASIRGGGASPFGENFDVLASPYKAIRFARENPDKVQLIRVNGHLSVTRTTPRSAYTDLTDSVLDKADIALVFGNDRRGVFTGLHVCMVYRPPTGDTLQTIDGNQSSSGDRSIRVVTRNLNELLPNGHYKLAFLHVKG